MITLFSEYFPRAISKALYICILSILTSIGAKAFEGNSVPQYGKEDYSHKMAAAKELYNNRFYSNALDQFLQLIEQGNKTEYINIINTEEAIAYKIMCLIMLEKPGTEGLISSFEKNYPYSPLIGKIKFRQAIIYFDNNNYAQAGKLFDSIDKRSLTKEERDEFVFRNGYCKMRTGNTAEAQNAFNAIIHNGTGAYLNPALYYNAYLKYANRDFANAIPLFKRAAKDPRFSQLCQYHILESKYMLKDYNYVITNGPKLYKEIEPDSQAKVARIISEAYYAVNDTEKAKYYFELYSLGGASLSKADNFYAGMISYTLGNYISASDSFAKVASNKDSLGQSAAYHMGQSYIQLKNKHNAQKAFKMASESNFDESIKEDAFFNYAKLSFDINRNMAPFNEYLASYRYTNSKWDEIHNYIATEYLMNGNYAPAIKALEKIKNATPYTTVNLQKASFLRAMQLIKSGSFSKAIPYLEQAVKYGSYNSALKNLSGYWLAECLYRRDMFDKSIAIIENLHKNSQFRQSEEFATSVYNLGYNYLKKGNYEKAAEIFGNYINMPPKPQPYANEAGVRLADCHFMMRDYSKAAELYEQIAIEQDYKDLYTPLQGAITYGLLNQSTKKIALLNEITGEKHKNSPLYSSALYELGRTLIQNVEDEKAEAVLQKLIDNPKDSSYYYKAMLEMGMIKANRQQFDQALDYYKSIVAKSPISEEGQSALAGIENIYQQQNKTPEFLAYLDSIGLSTIKSAGERETMLFNSAEQIFLGEDYQGALNALTNFISNYPDGAKTPNANFYIAECYKNLGKPEKAAEHYYKVMESGEGAFSEIATLNYGRISYDLEHYEEAVNAYETLYRIAQLGNNKAEAQTGKMKAYFMCRNYEQTLIDANKIIALENAPADMKLQAKYFKAKSHIALGDRENAIPLLQELAKKPQDETGAEATYLLIQDAFDAGNFKSVEEQTFAFSDSQTPQTYWLAKSFIVLGDSYAERENLEQAEATFKSIYENYSPQGNDDIAELLKIRLNKLEQMKKK